MLNNTVNMVDEWRPFSWHCPNCGKLVTMYRNSEGTVKMECPTCKVVMVRREMGRRHSRFDIYAPYDEEEIL